MNEREGTVIPGGLAPIMLRTVAELKGVRAPRVLLESPDEVVIETEDNKWERIVHIDARRGTMRWLQTDRPCINRQSGDWSGLRWASAQNRRSPTRRFEATWKDEDGELFEVTIPDEHCSSVACPPLGTRTYYGGRRSSLSGDGHLHCVSRGKLLWSFRPSMLSADHRRDYLGDGVAADELPFPYKVVSSRDGSFIAFTHKDTVFIVRDDGVLIGRHPLSRLHAHVYGTEYGNEPAIGSTFETPLGAFTITIEVGAAERASYAWPEPDAVKTASGGTSVVVGARSILTWFDYAGKVSQILRLSHGTSKGLESTCKVRQVEVSDISSLVIAGLSKGTIHSVRDGAVSSFMSSQPGASWTLSPSQEIVAFRSAHEGELQLLDSQFAVIHCGGPGTPGAHLQFSPQGNYLFETRYGTRIHQVMGEQ
ncbi:MAG TPA: hypothetical protein VGN57_04810 [Pirellulaceae bacterium]|jgi:hypothetical protein|nr:hypothetical protein [Pirellulaceae bacterium]